MNVPLTILILHDQCSYSQCLQLERPQLQSQLFSTNVDRVSTFGIVFLTEVSTAVVLQFVFSVSTSLSSVYVSLS